MACCSSGCSRDPTGTLSCLLAHLCAGEVDMSHGSPQLYKTVARATPFQAKFVTTSEICLQFLPQHCQKMRRHGLLLAKTPCHAQLIPPATFPAVTCLTEVRNRVLCWTSLVFFSCATKEIRPAPRPGLHGLQRQESGSHGRAVGPHHKGRRAFTARLAGSTLPAVEGIAPPPAEARRAAQATPSSVNPVVYRAHACRPRRGRYPTARQRMPLDRIGSSSFFFGLRSTPSNRVRAGVPQPASWKTPPTGERRRCASPRGSALVRAAAAARFPAPWSSHRRLSRPAVAGPYPDWPFLLFGSPG